MEISALNTPRVFLTGGSGFIGSQLAELATRAGWPVTVTTSINNDVERERVRRLEAAGIPVLVASLSDREKLLSALPGHDAVIHLAAAQHEAHAPESHFLAVNVEGTRTLLKLAAEAGVRRFVHGSTIGVYGAADGQDMLDESSPLAPDNPYGRTKAEAEGVVRDFRNNLEVCIVRISETYGPSDLRLLKLFRAIDRGRFVMLGGGGNEHQLIYVEDLVRGLLTAASEPKVAGETVVLAGSERLTTNEMVAAIARALGKSRQPPRVPMWPFQLAAVAMETTLPPLGLKPPLHRRRLDFFRKSFRFRTDKAEKLLGFRAQIPFAEGARRTAAWYRAHGQL